MCGAHESAAVLARGTISPRKEFGYANNGQSYLQRSGQNKWHALYCRDVATYINAYACQWMAAYINVYINSRRLHAATKDPTPQTN